MTRLKETKTLPDWRTEHGVSALSGESRRKVQLSLRPLTGRVRAAPAHGLWHNTSCLTTKIWAAGTQTFPLADREQTPTLQCHKDHVMSWCGTNLSGAAGLWPRLGTCGCVDYIISGSMKACEHQAADALCDFTLYTDGCVDMINKHSLNELLTLC